MCFNMETFCMIIVAVSGIGVGNERGQGGAEVKQMYTLGLGHQIWTQNGSDWPQMGQIRDFFRSDFNTFWRFDWPQMKQIRDFFRSDFSTFWRCSAKMY